MVTDAPPLQAPRTWVVLAEKGGDNAQVEALAGALPWPVERRDVRMRERWVKGKPRVRPTLAHVDLGASDPLEPPWPDLVLTMGRRTSSVALWIREQSGGRTRIVLVGKPSGRMATFDLVIGSSEVQLPPLRNVQRIGLPLLRADPLAVERAAKDWTERMASLPRPLVGILVGAATGPYKYDLSVVDRLAGLATRVAEEGGTPYVTTSRRTDPAIADALERALPDGAGLFRWRPDADDNPYLGLLGLADGFYVTGDSISMLVEVARLGRPLGIVSLPSGVLGPLDLRRRRFTRWLYTPPHNGLEGGLRRVVALLGFHTRLLWHTRDFQAFHDWLVDTGLARFADAPLTPPTGIAPDDLSEARRRVCALFPEAAPAARD